MCGVGCGAGGHFVSRAYLRCEPDRVTGLRRERVIPRRCVEAHRRRERVTMTFIKNEDGSLSLKTPYGLYRGVILKARRYPNGNLAVEILSEEIGSVMTPTVNAGVRLDDSAICIKDWSENEGIAEAMKDAGFLGGLVGTIPCGYCSAKVFTVTDALRERIGL